MRNHTALATLVLLIAMPSFAQDRRAEAWVQRTLRSMSLDEKVGQLLVPVIRGGFRNIESDSFLKLRRDIVDFHVGGYHVSAGDAAGMAVLINDMQRFARVPLLITADLEGGPGYVIPAATRFPLGMALGAAGSEDLAYKAAAATAKEARAVGINVDFYPVADVQNNPANPIINIRSFGEDVGRVSALTRAYVRGVQDGGVLATAKHFPGHGDVASDSHLELPVIDFDRARLDAVELPPFRAAIAEGVGAIMTAHIVISALEPAKGVPATLSRGVLTGLLRDDLKFDGLLFTDAMDMHAITKNFGEGDAAVRSIEAGADSVLYANAETVFPALKAAVESGRIPMSRVDEAVRRVLRAKARLGLDRYKPSDLTTLSTVVGSREHRQLSQQISDAAITLVRDERNSVPLRPSGQRVLHINLLDSRTGWREGPVGQLLAAEIPKRFPRTTTIQIDDGTTRNEYEMVRKMADMVDAVVVSAFIRVAAYKGSIDLNREQKLLLDDLSKIQKPFVFALFGSPYLLHHVPSLPSYILTYDTHPGAEMAAVKAITGEIPFKGKLPISLPGLYPVGHGLTR
ncbi:MAG TPA: glycoside hydrolase family 3 N-terminal domain-containing protein [Thermoanaerobaculia bacterium]|nr:glycoside hydrolase family 3 N-terminal domain-containing protein [Thermoanaerobaculia bacterium]